ncbi:MFS transporter [uncultured Nocardioides sp.]|uniref:MFS transporter n=1 Tax=uncultured Nocardioides sp. TaxID=198441 RepID=UPI0025EF53EE|nr:MFS transporter [uncultured Nocardioides sp.]
MARTRRTLVVDGGPEGGGTPIRRVAAASLIGSVIEWYDFFLYGTMVGLVFATQFFPTEDPATGTLLAFTTFAAGFVTRPLGGVIFGHLGDRLGRKPMLVVTMMIMGLATFAMGLLPTYETIGVAAPVLLVALRMLQGIGLGGEWGGAVLLCVEHAPEGRRGWYSSWPQLGVPIGLLLSTASVRLLGGLGDEALVEWAWRLPFLLSIVLVAIGLFIRLRITEPETFREVLASDDRATLPAWEALVRHPRATLLGMGVRMSESVTFNVYNAFLVAYVATLALAPKVILDALLVAAVVGFFAILGSARLSDRIGRRPVFAMGAGLALVSAFPIFALVDTGEQLWITVAVVVGWGLAACTMFGPEGVLFAELFPTRVRYSGMSTVYQLGVLPSGAVAPAVCTALVANAGGASWPAAVYVMAMAVVSLASLAFLPETFRRPLGDAAEPASQPAGGTR